MVNSKLGAIWWIYNQEWNWHLSKAYSMSGLYIWWLSGQSNLQKDEIGWSNKNKDIGISYFIFL